MRKIIFVLIALLSVSSVYTKGIPTTSYVYTTEDEAMEVPSPFDFEAIYYPDKENSSFADIFIAPFFLIKKADFNYNISFIVIKVNELV